MLRPFTRRFEKPNVADEVRDEDFEKRSVLDTKTLDIFSALLLLLFEFFSKPSHEITRGTIDDLMTSNYGPYFFLGLRERVN